MLNGIDSMEWIRYDRQNRKDQTGIDNIIIGQNTK